MIRTHTSQPTFAPVPPSPIVAGMFSYDKWKPDARTDAYSTPCGRYSVERTGAERFEVYGPAGFIEWFVSPNAHGHPAWLQ